MNNIRVSAARALVYGSSRYLPPQSRGFISYGDEVAAKDRTQLKDVAVDMQPLGGERNPRAVMGRIYEELA